MYEINGAIIEAWKKSGGISSISFLFPGGSAIDPEGREGLSRLVSEMILGGYEGFSGEKFLRRVEGLGEVNSLADFDFIMVNLVAENENVLELIELIFRVFYSPAIEPEEIERAKKKIIGDLNAISNSPSEFAEYLLPFYVFRDHPYGHHPVGKEESIESISKDDLEKYFNSLTERGLYIGIVSPEPDEILLHIEKHLENLKLQHKKLNLPAPYYRRGMEIIYKEGISQSYVESVGYLPPVYLLNEPALLIFNAAYGGSFTSRLVQKIRVENGLTYSIHSMPEWRKVVTLLRVSTSTLEENRVIELLEEEWERVQRGITESEFERAKEYVLGSFPIKFEGAENVSFFLARRLYYGLENGTVYEFIERLRKVELKDIEKIALKLSREHFTLVLSPSTS